MAKVIRLTESDLARIVKRVLSEGLGQGNFKVGQTFEDVNNREFIMSKSYANASSGQDAQNYNDFDFDKPKVVAVDKDGVTLKLDYGYYNPNETWKEGQTETRLSNFCLKIPFQRIIEVRDNQLMVSINNTTVGLYLDKGCANHQQMIAEKTAKAKKCGHNSWEEYKKSGWKCQGSK